MAGAALSPAPSSDRACHRSSNENRMNRSRNIFLVEQAKSDIRFRILERFREADITIPFPQRDLHMIPPQA